MLRIVSGAVLLVLMTAAPARAQYTGALPGGPGGGFDDQQFYWNVMPSGQRMRSQSDIDQERRYQDTLRNRIPDKKQSKDPWAGVRSTAPARLEDRHRPQ